MPIEIIPVRSHKIIEESDSLLEVFFEALKQSEVDLKDGDILVVTSKVVSVTEGRSIPFSKIQPGDEAKALSKEAKLPPEFIQIVLDNSKSHTGLVPGALTTLNKYGLLANAGADLSNAGPDKVIVFPKDPKESAKMLHDAIKESGINVGIILADSRMTPLRSGTIGLALATYGFNPIVDERGKMDLYGRPMKVTTRAVADQLASAAELVMGETDERIPFVVIRGYSFSEIKSEDEYELIGQIDPKDCMFLGSFLKKGGFV